MLNYFKRRKIKTFIVLLILFGVAYYGYTRLTSREGETRYLLATVERGTITVSVSGSGQVSASNQVEVKPKASGDVLALGVSVGQEVRAGAMIVQLNSRDAQKAVRDAEANLESARLSLEKLTKPAEALTVLQAESALVSARDLVEKLTLAQRTEREKNDEAKKKAEDDLTKAYEDGFNSVANTFLDLPAVVSGLQGILFGTTLSGGSQWNADYYVNATQNVYDKMSGYRTTAVASYQTARKQYDAALDAYKTASRFSERPVILPLIRDTYESVKSIAEAVKNANNLIQFYKDNIIERGLKTHALAETHLTDLNTSTSKTNGHLSTLLAIQRTMQTNEEAMVNATREKERMDVHHPRDLAQATVSVREREASLAKLLAGPDALDIQSQKLAVRQRENSLRDAQEKISDYTIRAPFDGKIAKLDSEKGDAVSTGTVVATLITAQRLAEISLNEIDVAKIQVGDRATLTFDAVPELSISGVVADIDAIGTVAQGVVSYMVKVSFDTQDDRVKPGMSVSAAIITDVKTDVLLVPNSAVKSQGSVHVVDVMDAELSSQSPRRQTVEIGLANDDVTEIVSGLSERETVVISTITAKTTTNTNQSQAPAFRIPGLPGGGGGGENRGGFSR